MSSDPTLKAAISHWGARFVANGVVLTDFEEITASLENYDGWCAAWSARAAHHEQIGREALARKHFLTAAECLQRAGVYYHFGSFLFVNDVAQMKVAHLKGVACREAALPFLRPPGERVTIPGLKDQDDWERFEAARLAVCEHSRNTEPAPRYRAA